MRFGIDNIASDSNYLGELSFGKLRNSGKNFLRKIRKVVTLRKRFKLIFCRMVVMVVVVSKFSLK